MRTHASGFKNAIKQFGKEISAKVIYTLNNQTITLDDDDLNSISYHYNGDILKSVMKQLDIDSNTDIALNTIVNFQFGVKVGNSYEYLDYGNFAVYKSEKQEDTDSYRITCYDKMLYSMIDYETPKISGTAITYPITIRNYLSAICSHLGLTFANSSDTFTNYDKEIPSELYLDNQGGTLGYTFRDVLDELAEVTASIICINDNDELGIRYVIPDEESNNLFDKSTVTNNSKITSIYIYSNNATKISDYIDIHNYEKIRIYNNTLVSESTYQTGGITGAIFCDENKSRVSFVRLSSSNPFNLNVPENAYYFRTTLNNSDLNTLKIVGVNEFESINEDFLKDINVKFGEQYGPINTITFTRSGGADSISLSNPNDLADNLKKAIVIEGNQILNDDNRSDYLLPILTKLYGLNYYLNDFSSFGISYLELGDRYKISIKIDNYNYNYYPCIILNDELNINRGLEEIIYTDMPEQAETDYTKTTGSDKLFNKTSLIVDKVNNEISSVVSRVGTLENTRPTQTEVTSQINQKADEITLSVNQTLTSYSTTTEMNSAINVKAGEINQTVSTKVGKDEVISSINQTSEAVTINANKINLNGVITNNNGFIVDINGYVTTNGATINGKIKASEFTGNTENVKLKIGSDTGGYASTDNTLEFLTSDNSQIFSIFQKRFANNINVTYFNTGSNNGFYFIGKLETNSDIKSNGKILGTNLDCGDGYANYSTWATIYFNQTFPSTPHVTVTPDTTESGIIALKIKNVSTTSFEVIVGGSGSSTIYFRWIAMSR